MQAFGFLVNGPLQNRLTSSTNTKVAQLSAAVNIREPWNAPQWIYSYAWKLHEKVVPLLHYFDRCSLKNNKFNLAVLWGKAISGCKLGSPTFDGFIAYDLLPPVTRWIVGFPFSWMYPNLFHQHVAIRTAFLDKCLLEALEPDRFSNKIDSDAKESSILIDKEVDSADLKPRVIILGAGFDTRSLRCRGTKTGKSEAAATTAATVGGKHVIPTISTVNAEFYEVDLPSVIQMKVNVFKRFLLRRPHSILPKLYGADLNELDQVKKQLALIFSDNEMTDKIRGKKRKTVFVIEAVLMYLKKENVMPLLSTCMSEAAKHSSTVDVCFADHLPGVPFIGDVDGNVGREAASKLLKTVGLDLTTWQPRIRYHMGLARYEIKK